MTSEETKPEQTTPGTIDEKDLQSLARLAHLQSVTRDLENLVEAVFASASWSLGQKGAGWLRKLGLRIPPSLAEPETRRLLAELKELAELVDGSRPGNPEDILLGTQFRLSVGKPRRYPVNPPARPADWNVDSSTRQRLAERIAEWPSPPRFSVLVPVYNTKPEWLKATVDSVLAQFYPHWQLCLVDDASTSRTTLKMLQSFSSDERIQVQRRANNGGIVAATNDALTLADGDFIALLDHDDLLEPDALLQCARAIVLTGADLVYSDEDKLSEDGQRYYEPHHKPAWSPDLLLAQNYISHLTVIRRSLVEKVGGLRAGYDGSQDHDLLLRCVEQAREVVHIPMVLYHWRAVQGSTALAFGEKAYPWEAGKRSVADALQRTGTAGTAELGPRPGTYRVKRTVQGSPLVSILIPFRDQPELLQTCLDSILEKTDYPHFEIIGLNNDSAQTKTLNLIEHYRERDQRIRFIDDPRPFNFSAINNLGAQQARGEHLLLLNNDTEVIEGEWLEALLAHSQREEVGAVGAKLLYSNGRIQHAGVILGIVGVAGHSHKNVANDDNGYFSRPHLTQNISAVTGACLMVKRALWEALGGLNEEKLAIAFNDIDFCLRLRAKDLLNIYEPQSLLYHHESISRGFEDSPEKQARFLKETQNMKSLHGRFLLETDPYFNPNLSAYSEIFLSR